MSRPHAIPCPLVDDWDWQQQGLCRGVDSSVFFHPDGERGHARTAREERAKQLCAQCPVLISCREHALALAEPYGIWGGLSESERLSIIKERGRTRSGRPAAVAGRRAAHADEPAALRSTAS
nr:WhiB family transcriptional regulator [Tomitella gaofuii]